MTRRLANILWIPAIIVGTLQMLRINAGPLTEWGTDFFGPIALYGSLRTNGTVARWFADKPPSAFLSALFVFVGCVAWEVGQFYDLVSGHYDPADIAAYALGVAVAVGGETLLERRHRRNFTSCSRRAADSA